MNRQTTWILLVITVLLAMMIFITDQTRTHRQNAVQQSKTAIVLNCKASDVQVISVKRDYWNSFTLRKTPEGTWKFIDPSDEPASMPAVNQLLGMLESLPRITVIDLPMNDSERYKEYGLWQPREQITVSAGEKEYILLLGADTKDETGVYCAILGQDNVYVTSQEAYKRLAMDMVSYRIPVAGATPAVKE